jgi:hypothetical protein
MIYESKKLAVVGTGIVLVACINYLIGLLLFNIFIVMTDSKNEQEDQELADKIKPLIDEIKALEEKRNGGISLKKNDYVGDRLRDLDAEIGRLKTPKEK